MMNWARFAAGSLLVSLFLSSALAAGQQRPRPGGPPTLGLADGFLDFDTPDFTLRLVKDSQTVAALKPKSAAEFDFTPADWLERRASNNFYHLGDLTFRARTDPAAPWVDYSTAADRHAVLALPAGKTLAAADLGPTLPHDCPLAVHRNWSIERGRLTLRFELKNTGTKDVQIGALGIPMVFNDILMERNLQQSHEHCSFSDPYIGQDGGYIQVTPLSGKGPALVVVPAGETPFEAYRLLNEPIRPNQTFEGMFAWMVHTQAYAEKEWKGVQQWNPPSSETLKPGETRAIGVRFLVSPSIRAIESTLAANNRPVAVGIPGYILPMDQNGKLFLKYARGVKQLESDPAGAIAFEKAPSQKGWKAYTLHGKTWGRARLTVTYDDGTKQAVSYYVTKPAAQAVADLGHFLTTKQWFTDSTDPFHRAPSAISYDREADRQVVQDSRVWIAGLGDEGGSGSWLAAGMKEFGLPDPEEVAKYEQFVDGVLWGGIQFKDGPNKYGVRKSVFFYDPKEVPGFTYDPNLDWTSWTSWNKQASEDIGRGYNYPHVVAAYWSMYRLARNYTGLVKNHPWDWYLEQAYETTKFLTDTQPDGQPRVWYVDMGLMEGDVFVALLQDLQREGWTDKAAEIEARMKKRVEHWASLPFPFGSEMAWDSTGQEEVYAWCKYFGREDKAEVSLDSILGYMPSLPHWGYNGNARRYWDFLYGGKLSRIERQLHHYGSGLNAIPVLSEYRQHPGDYYLLRIGYGGAMGSLSNIDQEGFASVAFHSFPSTLKWDAYSGDYGPNFFGHAFNTATYIVDHPDFGWQAFGGNVSTKGRVVTVEPRDSFRSRVYVAPLGLWLTLDAGAFEQIQIDPKTHVVRVGLSPATAIAPQARLHIEQPATVPGVGKFAPNPALTPERDGYTIPLGSTITWIELSQP